MLLLAVQDSRVPAEITGTRDLDTVARVVIAQGARVAMVKLALGR
jgi:hypothetical protein